MAFACERKRVNRLRSAQYDKLYHSQVREALVRAVEASRSPTTHSGPVMSPEQFAQIIARLDAIESRLGPGDAYLDAKQAAEYLGFSVRRIYAGARTGTQTRAKSIGGTVKTKKEWLDLWFTSKAA